MLPGERVLITLEPGSDEAPCWTCSRRALTAPHQCAPISAPVAAARSSIYREACLPRLEGRAGHGSIEGAWALHQNRAGQAGTPGQPAARSPRARPSRSGAVLGYRRARSHDLIDVSTCPVLTPNMSDSLARLKPALAPLLGGKREARVTVTETEGGLDVLLEGARPNPAAIGAFAAQAAALGVARLTAGGESIVLEGALEVDLSGAKVKLPPGAFLQASREAEAELVKLTLQGTEGAKRVADLFAGLGTFTFALARTSAVDAYEADEVALAALAEAARRTPKLKPVRTFVRDLFRSPLGAKELDPYDAVVFDPPRAGAGAQAEALAKSRVPALVAVSCDPGTLARDLRILLDGGYRITRVVPVDQFLFSPHIEVVAHLER